MNGRNILKENATVMSGIPFPGTKADFVKKLYLGKFDATSGSNLEAFQVSCYGSIVQPLVNSPIFYKNTTFSDPKKSRI